jgi:hypothetical protein
MENGFSNKETGETLDKRTEFLMVDKHGIVYRVNTMRDPTAFLKEIGCELYLGETK